MRLLRLSALSLLASTLVLSTAFAETSITTSTSVTVKSCTRMSDGKEKAKCEWENHEAYVKMGTQTSSSTTASVVELNLPSCARQSGIDKVKCQEANRQAMLKALNHGSSSSTSSSVSSAKSKPADPCKNLKGLKKFACKRKQRTAKKAI